MVTNLCPIAKATTQNNEDIFMFDMMIPPTLVSSPLPVVQVAQKSPPQTRASDNLGKLNGDYTACRDVESELPDSAQNVFSPLLHEVLKRLGSPKIVSIKWLSSLNAKASLIEAPNHGQIDTLDTSQSFIHDYIFKPEAGYTGQDRAVYLIEAQGKRFKVTINFLVLPVVWEEIQQCKYVKFNK